MIPQFPSFAPILSVNLDAYKAFTNRYEPYSDFNYTSIVSWDTQEQARISILHDNLILEMKDYDTSNDNIISILGATKIEQTINQIIDHKNISNDAPYGFKLIPEFVIKTIPQTKAFEIHHDIDNDDYILSCEEANDLPGKKYINKRKNLARFLRDYPQCRISKSNLDDPQTWQRIINLCEYWASLDTDGSKAGDDDLKAIKRLLVLMPKLKNLNIQCMSIYNNDKFVAFCIYEILNAEWAISHFGKSDITIRNLYEFMMVEVLRDLHSQGIKWLNYEQDLGIPGLRQNKLSCKPSTFLKKYIIQQN